VPQLSNSAKVIRHSNAVAAGTSTITPSGSIDLANAEGVMFLVAFGTITGSAVTSIKLQQSDDNGVADGFSDIVGTSLTVPDTASNKIFVVDHYKPTKRYVKVIVSRATQNAVLDGITAVVYGTRNQPITADSTVGGSEQHSGAIEGTA